MIINPYSNEIENIVFTIQQQEERCITITSPNRFEGTSTVAHSVTQRMLLDGYSVLLLDINSRHPSVEKILDVAELETAVNHGNAMTQASTHDTAQPSTQHLTRQTTQQPTQLSTQLSTQLPTPALVSPVGERSVFTGLLLEDNKALITQLRKPNALKQHIETWLEQFDYIIIDSPCLVSQNNHAIPAECIPQACGALIMVVMAQHTTEESMNHALRKLTQHNVKILGIVINDRLNPGLKEELKRQLERIKRWFPHLFGGVFDRLARAMDGTSFFSIET